MSLDSTRPRSRSYPTYMHCFNVTFHESTRATLLAARCRTSLPSVQPPCRTDEVLPCLPHRVLHPDTNSRNSFIQRLSSAAPLGYTTPVFPSLYWPLPPDDAQSFYLYYPNDILRFTIYWTLLLVGGIHLIVALWACIIQWRNWKIIWVVPPLFAAVGAMEGVIAGSIVGGLLGGVYQSGYYEMSTWIPFVWGVINAMVLILSSFAIYGGL